MIDSQNMDLIIGIHSIVCAIANPNRTLYKLVGTEDALEEVAKKVSLEKVQVEMYSSHKLQEEAKKYFKQLGLEYHRVPSGVFLLAASQEINDVNFLYEQVEKNSKPLKILCLDQITDVHNAAAILRTASFYGVDFVVVPDKKSFGLTPSFFRISSGAAEFIPLVGVNKLGKTLTKLQNMGILCLALSEHAKGSIEDELHSNAKGICLVLGKEDVGISNAVLRVIPHHISLESMGDTQSLNVSIAAAITMERCFRKN